MAFQHAEEIWRDFPELSAGVLRAGGITPDPDVADGATHFTAIAQQRLDTGTANGNESELPEIQTWRRTFSRMGLKPTQYRCAAESLLRRLRKEGSLPSIHPLVDLCNAVSVAFATPVAVFDLDHVDRDLTVRRATGDEPFVTLGGDIEHPAPDEVIFADASGHAHARRWSHRQSGATAIRPETTDVLVVAEAMHATAAEDVRRLVETLGAEIGAIWTVTMSPTVLSAGAPRLDW